MNMDYRNLKRYHYLHLSNIKISTLLQEELLYENMDEIKMVLEVKKNIERCRQAFYKLFDEHTRKELTNIDKKVRKAYDKVIKKLPCLLKDRYTLTIGLNKDDEMVRPDSDNTYQRVHQFIREKEEFVPKTSIKGENARYSEEERLLIIYQKELQELAKLLYIQEEYVKLAIETSLRDKRLREIAIESAVYIGYIDGYILKGAKKIIR